jgi:hypothetical protein
MAFHTLRPDVPPGPLKHEQPGFRLADLLDIHCERRFAPLLVQWMYIGSLALITAVTLFGLLISWWLASWAAWSAPRKRRPWS